MWIVERNPFTIRTRMMTYTNETTKSVIQIVPQIGCGSLRYYNDLRETLKDQDIVIYLKPPLPKELLRRKVTPFKLVKVPKDLRTDKFLSDHVLGKQQIEIVFPNSEIDRIWNEESIWFRAFLIACGYTIGVFLPYFYTFEKQSKSAGLRIYDVHERHLESETRNSYLSWKLAEVISELVIETLSSILEANCDETKRVTILVSAKAVQNISRYLVREKNYKLTKSDWLTVIG